VFRLIENLKALKARDTIYTKNYFAPSELKLRTSIFNHRASPYATIFRSFRAVWDKGEICNTIHLSLTIITNIH